MINVKNRLKCSGCSACMNICPHDAISMKPDKEGFIYPVIDKNKCINCNKCIRVCPYNNEWEPPHDMQKCIVGYNLNPDEREAGSSGAIFSLLAMQTLEDGGVVFGAAYDKDFMVFHSKAETPEQLKSLIGSKYLQSRIETSYRQVQEYLQNNRKVLFVGTTCQIAGLKGYLRKDYDQLLCVDFVCLGIPSPLVWKDYLVTYFPGETIIHVNFKSKSRGWHTFSLAIDTDKQHFSKDGKSTFFFSGYFKGLYSRPCCSDCIFKNNKNRISDITLSDSWGCEEFAAEIDDNKGLSNIIIHNDKGDKAFLSIKNKICYKQVEFEKIIEGNKNYYYSLPMGSRRDEFWSEYDGSEKKVLFRKYCSSNYGIKKVYRTIKLSLKGLFRKRKYDCF